MQAFLNTRWDLGPPGGDGTAGGGGHGTLRDRLDSPGALRAWLREHGLIDSRATVSDDDLARALAVREGLRALAFANNGHPLDRRRVAAMDAAADEATAAVRLTPEGVRFAPPRAGGVRGAIGALLAHVAAAMLDGSWARLKACPGRDCGWVFYDASRNLSSRWCSMRVCGGREKARAYYRRRRARR